MKKFILSSALCLSALSPFAHATDGVFTLLEGGYAKQSGLPTAEDVGANRHYTTWTPPSWRFAVGYNHDFTHCFGLGMEVASGHYARDVYTYSEGGRTYIRARSMEFLADFQFHYHQWDWIAKAGGIRKTALIDGKNAPPNQTQIRAMYGIDAIYNFTPHIAGILSYAHLGGEPIRNFDRFRNTTPSLNAYLLGMRYIFF